jgi:hypothetical protein
MVFQWTLPRRTPEANDRVESTQELIKYESDTLMPWASKRIVLARHHSIILKQIIRSILRALLNRILQFVESALEMTCIMVLK